MRLPRSRLHDAPLHGRHRVRDAPRSGPLGRRRCVAGHRGCRVGVRTDGPRVDYSHLARVPFSVYRAASARLVPRNENLQIRTSLPDGRCQKKMLQAGVALCSMSIEATRQTHESLSQGLTFAAARATPLGLPGKSPAGPSLSGVGAPAVRSEPNSCFPASWLALCADQPGQTDAGARKLTEGVEPGRFPNHRSGLREWLDRSIRWRF